VRRWTGVATVAVTFRSAHSSAVFAKQSGEEDRAESVPTSSTTDGRVIVGWGLNEKSWLYVVCPLLANKVLILADSHNIWLRDHCRCSECFHPVTKQRLVDTFDVSGHPRFPLRFVSLLTRAFGPLQIPADIAPLSVESKSHGLEVTCKFRNASIVVYLPVLIRLWNRAGFDTAFVGLSLVVAAGTFV
jgi:hypothetical protein